MGLQIKKNSTGTGYRPTWYIRYRDSHGKYVSKNSGLSIQGTPPPSLALKDTGDAAFEKSRAKAEAFLEKFLSERKIKGAAQELTRTLIEDKTGQELRYERIDGLFTAWLGFSRVRDVTETRKSMAKSLFERFVNHLKSAPDTRSWEFLYEVTPAAAKSFIDGLKGTLATATVRDHLSLLTGTFGRLLPNGIPNPFQGIKVGDGTADSQKIHRIPLTDEQLEKIIEEAKKSEDKFLHPITVCAAWTGLRIGDVCCLKWEDVYLNEGRISVITSKCGIRVDLPIFPELQKVLESALAEKEDGEAYVFPEAASMYIHNRSGIRYRGKLLFAKALFGEDPVEEPPTEVVNGVPKPPMTESEVLAAIDACPKFFAAKKEKTKEVYLRYKRGESYSAISKALGYSRGQINGYLADVEKCTGEKILPGTPKSNIRTQLAKTRREHKTGKNAVSVYGWHSLRATYVVRAHERHIPDEMIRAAVGHTTFETTRKYYLHPTWQMFKAAWENNGRTQSVLPALPSQGLLPSTAPVAMDAERARRLLASTLTAEQILAFRALRLTLKAS